ncbi:MAG: gamma-glutamyl-gamma-aminobutyrate hydrolase family protein [Nitrososphaerota archaeon]|nr:gamma-glutamyl-gamma-aminobutyrate hydrolase family protein [Nitrososphaerales archaeon]MCX8192003.1 gamma-glutamyl-gamma-aminobutyrate hydrolase family protein [Nitrososphaerales archaeon]MDW8044893.1 gamma-glutamyl-gamma-aminobutyrate hydrolase family protein [Nitrososphaerota archaeon]
MRLLIINNLSSLISNLEEILRRLNVEFTIKRYDSEVDLNRYSKVILSGRMVMSKDISRANLRILRMIEREDIPTLGICYGAEIIATYFGGTLMRMNEFFKGFREVIVRKENPLTSNRSRIYVYESHIFKVSRLPDALESLAYSNVCENEIFSHKSKRIYGVQFHPEYGNEDGIFILKNFLFSI